MKLTLCANGRALHVSCHLSVLGKKRRRFISVSCLHETQRSRNNIKRAALHYDTTKMCLLDRNAVYLVLVGIFKRDGLPVFGHAWGHFR